MQCHLILAVNNKKLFDYQWNSLDDEVTSLDAHEKILFCQDKKPLFPILIRVESKNISLVNAKIVVWKRQFLCPVSPLGKIEHSQQNILTSFLGRSLDRTSEKWTSL